MRTTYHYTPHSLGKEWVKICLTVGHFVDLKLYCMKVCCVCVRVCVCVCVCVCVEKGGVKMDGMERVREDGQYKMGRTTILSHEKSVLKKNQIMGMFLCDIIY